MLTTLRIKNFAIIEDLELHFQPGFTVLTGETGAGKSIIIDALALLLGHPASEDMIRRGADTALIEGMFHLTEIPEPLRPYIDSEEPLILLRKLSRNKDNLARINQQTVPLKTLKKATASLANIIGQHEHMSLLSEESQRGLLDAQPTPLYEQYKVAFQAYKICLDQVEKKEKNHQDLSQKIDFLRFQLQDLSTPHFKPEEENELGIQKNTLKNLAKHQEHLTGLAHTLDELAQLQKTAQKHLDALGPDHPISKGLAPSLTTQSLELADHRQWVQTEHNALAHLENLDIEAIESRLDVIFKYKTKYKMPSLIALIDYQNTLKAQLLELENTETSQEALLQQLSTLKAQAQKLALALHHHRSQKAHQLGADVENQLKALHFAFPKFEIQVAYQENALTEHGADSITFMISTNPGEPLKPLAKVASGGELSRLMLAIKTVFFHYNPVPTLLFDEIDVGVGGLAATKIGESLQVISKHTQAFCITHLPQIAAYANHHFVVTKTLTQNSTHTQVSLLKPEEKAQELQRMIGGESIQALLF